MNKSRIRVVGWNGICSDGSDSTDLILNDLREIGYQTEDINYPKVRGFIDAWFSSRLTDRALKVMKHHQEGDCAIAHSYGCNVLRRTMELGAVYKHVFLFSPAMDANVQFPEGAAESITVFHHRRDRVIFLGMLLPWHPFGAMGRYGYQGARNNAIENVEYHHVAEGESFTNHSNYFCDEVRHKFVHLVDNKIAYSERMSDMLRKEW